MAGIRKPVTIYHKQAAETVLTRRDKLSPWNRKVCERTIDKANNRRSSSRSILDQLEKLRKEG